MPLSWYALLIDHGLFSVRSKNTLTKAILLFLNQLQCQPEQVWGKKGWRSESVDHCYYAKHMIMMILMIMVMNVHNLFPLSVKMILMQAG